MKWNESWSILWFVLFKILCVGSLSENSFCMVICCWHESMVLVCQCEWRGGMWPFSAFKTRYPPGALFKNNTSAVKKIDRVNRNENTVIWYGMHTHQTTVIHHKWNKLEIMEHILFQAVRANVQNCGRNCEGNENTRSTYVCAIPAV